MPGSILPSRGNKCFLNISSISLRECLQSSSTVSLDVRYVYCGVAHRIQQESRSQKYAPQKFDLASTEVFLREPASVANVAFSGLSGICIRPQSCAGCRNTQSDSRTIAPAPIYFDYTGNPHDLPSSHGASGSDRFHPQCELLRLRPYGLGKLVDQRGCGDCPLAWTWTE